MRKIIIYLLAASVTFCAGVTIFFCAQRLPLFHLHVLAAREVTLRNDLFEMRRTIDRVAADWGRLPSSLEDLVRGGYLREVPIDPITGRKDWVLIMGEDPNSVNGAVGLKDVRSASRLTGLDGTSYDTW